VSARSEAACVAAYDAAQAAFDAARAARDSRAPLGLHEIDPEVWLAICAVRRTDAAYERAKARNARARAVRAAAKAAL
jgi:hypothetical protein